MLTVTTAPHNGVWVLTVQGEIDDATAPVLYAQFQALLDGDVHEFVLDLTQVGFMGSVGISALLWLRRKVEPAGGWLRLVSSPVVARIIMLTGLATQLPGFTTVEGALLGDVPNVGLIRQTDGLP